MAEILKYVIYGLAILFIGYLGYMLGKSSGHGEGYNQALDDIRKQHKNKSDS